jgi:HD-GYP domain-containing protein (c-di-GMP phosphodiesterase class II)
MPFILMGETEDDPLVRATHSHEPVVLSSLVHAKLDLAALGCLAYKNGSGVIVPLVARGKVLGLLGLISPQANRFTAEDASMLALMGSTAATAMENADLYQGLQHSNWELLEAYEQTLEGWSKALDLRDRETENHTQRVTNMTIQLGHELGLSTERLVHIRRGAMLHDIGKLGVQDKILLKNGPLTDEEWDEMRRHPGHAYDMLAPIAYLRSALNIPFCHHEKWDGSGYPRGLKGEEIPVEARIFAIIDVYDALTNHRPYRPAWPRSQAVQYIRDQSGRHFDPDLVQVFLRLIEKPFI